jgi:hypothetical protein
MVSDASQLVDGRQVDGRHGGYGGQDSSTLRRPSVAVDSEKHHDHLLVCELQELVLLSSANGTGAMALTLFITSTQYRSNRPMEQATQHHTFGRGGTRH